MKQVKILLGALAISFAFIAVLPTAKASGPTNTNYRLTLCRITYPDGVFHLAAQCIEPEAEGPCDKVAQCSGGAPPPQIQ